MDRDRSVYFIVLAHLLIVLFIDKAIGHFPHLVESPLIAAWLKIKQSTALFIIVTIFYPRIFQWLRRHGEFRRELIGRGHDRMLTLNQGYKT